ncbi:hypothetical protein Tco_0808349 [Tanacetum coccineum]
MYIFSLSYTPCDSESVQNRLGGGILRRLEAFVASPIGCGGSDVGIAWMRPLFIELPRQIKCKKRLLLGKMMHAQQIHSIFMTYSTKQDDNNKGSSVDDSLKYPPVFIRKKEFLERINPGWFYLAIEWDNSKDEDKLWDKYGGGARKKIEESLIARGKRSSSDDFMSLNIQGLAQKAKNDWVKELCVNSKSHYDYGPVPFRFFHYWFEMEGFDKFVEESWKEALVAEAIALIKMMKRLKYLKEKIRVWNKTNKESPNNSKRNLKAELAELDSAIDKGEGDGDCNPCHFVRSEFSNISFDMFDCCQFSLRTCSD